ncbi:MAG: hypothetical protein AB1499_08915 [Nitrospirota bacterium]
MKNECCNIKVTEKEDGYQIEVTGEGVKEKCKSILERCCSGSEEKKSGKSCC